MNRSPQAGLVPGVAELKSRLHRYIIEQLEDESDNLLEGPRTALGRFVGAKVGDYTRQSHFAISRYGLDRLTEELVDELGGFGPLEGLPRDHSVSAIPRSEERRVG